MRIFREESSIPGSRASSISGRPGAYRAAGSTMSSRKWRERYDGKVSFYRVDVNECGGTASRFAVRSIPTLLFFHEGEVVDQAVGSVSREDIEEKLEKLLGTA